MRDPRQPVNIDAVIDIEQYLIPELRKLETGSAKSNSLLLLIVTLVLFFSTGMISADVGDILVLVAVLFFHELGHLVTMKLLRYNDVKMFFIPFFGAAVSGKSANDSALKSCLVSMSGPLPGIILGVLLYVLFALTKNFYLFKAAQVTLLLNAMNILPIMPLDGGRYVDVLFIGNKLFRLLFALFGVSIFLVLAIASSDIILGLFGVLALVGAINNFKLNSVAIGLKKAGVRFGSVQELTNCVNDLRAITTALYYTFPKIFKPISGAAIYRYISELVNTLKFKPAGIPAKIGLMLVYLLTVLVSIMCALFFTAMNYHEKVVSIDSNGSEIKYLQRYSFNRKGVEVPIDENLALNGKGLAFGSDTTKITDVFYYAHGYRTGTWIKLDSLGDTTGLDFYSEKGRLDSSKTLKDGVWTCRAPAQFPFFKRLSAEISFRSQPIKSLHRHFKAD